jgi:Holliday junction resolvasome RuvABC endonuclease subunit
MRILALDQASIITGYAIFDDGDLVSFGKLTADKSVSPEDRFEEMCRKIHLLFLKSKADIIIFEDVSLRTSIKTLITLSRLQGAIMDMSYWHNTAFKIYAPTQWRKVLGFNQGNKVNREALKTQAIDYVSKCYGITAKDDIAEAICIGLAYLRDSGVIEEIKEKKK